MDKHIKKQITKQIDSWNCLGYTGYGQGRAVAEFGADEIGSESVCHKVCPKSDKCRQEHYEKMDERFPEVAQIVRKTAVMAKKTGLPIVETVISAMNVAVKREIPEAKRIQQGLLKYRVETMTDHYIYGQFENLEHGLQKEPADTTPVFLLVSAK
jgi:hypothetical protein